MKSLNKENHKKLIEEMNLITDNEIQNTKRKKLGVRKNKNLINKSKDSEKRNKISVNNIEIPEGTHPWRNQKLPEVGTIFTDDLFPPTKSNLCKLNNSGQWDLPEDVEESEVVDWEKIKWKRVDNIFNSSEYQVFYDKIEKDDIIQGNLGNCYFLSAIASLCKYPNLIEKLFFFKEKSDEHCYGCYFRINGIWKLVLLDDYIPSLENNFAFTHTNGNELWVILLEKAWAKLNGNYARIIGGDPHEIFEVLTNAYCEKFMFNKLNKEEIWLKYKNAQEKGFLMIAGTNCDEELPLESMGLISGHAYTVLKVVEIKTDTDKEKLINLRNPWGYKEWIGDWCDSSSKWTQDIREQCQNYEIKDDGSFWMSFEDFYGFFIIGGICHLYQDYCYSSFHIFKESSIKGAFLSKLIINDDNTHCFLILHQKNPRVVLRDGQYQNPVLCYLMLLNSNFEYIASSYGQEKNIKIEITLNKGIYYMISDINYRLVQKEQHGYTLSCYSSNPAEIIIEKNYNVENAFKSSLLSFCEKNLNPKKSKGGFLYKIKKRNKHFPFSFILFDNRKGNKEIILSDLIKINGNKNVSFYFEDNVKDNLSITKKIIPGQYDILCCMPHEYGILYSIEYKTESKKYNNILKQLAIPLIEEKNIKDNSKLYNDIFNEEYEILDDDGFIRQYLHITKENYYIGIENTSNKKININLKVKYFINDIEQKINTYNFDLISKMKKIFILNYINNFIGEISFSSDIKFY